MNKFIGMLIVVMFSHVYHAFAGEVGNGVDLVKQGKGAFQYEMEKLKLLARNFYVFADLADAPPIDNESVQKFKEMKRDGVTGDILDSPLAIQQPACIDLDGKPTITSARLNDKRGPICVSKGLIQSQGISKAQILAALVHEFAHHFGADEDLGHRMSGYAESVYFKFMEAENRIVDSETNRSTFPTLVIPLSNQSTPQTTLVFTSNNMQCFPYLTQQSCRRVKPYVG